MNPNLPESTRRILEVRRPQGDDVLVLAHHYQRPEIVLAADSVGDSFQLARFAASSKARRVAFCGVSFMGESAAVLAPEGTEVYLPEPSAGCPMADMADPADVERMLRLIKQALPGKSLLPVTYVNSSAAVKAITGREGGLVCTSSNARNALDWALRRADLVLFLPDLMLALNTARELGVGPVVRLDPFGLEPDFEALARSRVAAWNGYCHVHTWFTPNHVAQARTRYPTARVLVHPECPEEVVQAADGSGSTQFLVSQVEQGVTGSVFVIGTEVNLVKRLAMAHPDKTVMPLATSLCPNMYRTTPRSLELLLSSWPGSHRVQVAPDVVANARVALERMLAL